MAVQIDRRDEFIKTLGHIERIATKVAGSLGRGGVFTFPDHHKISEGLFLSAWTHWEEFIRLLLVDDLSEDPAGFVRKDVRKFRVKGAPRRIAERVLFHPDHPQMFVGWDYGLVKSRADDFLPANHRFCTPLPRAAELELLKRIRNAIAHKSDRAWESFRNLTKNPPFSLQSRQLRGLTVGRFLSAHQWNNQHVLNESVQIHLDNANHLVP